MTRSYLFDQATLDFMEKVNPWAIRDISEKLLEAIQREMWRTPEPETVNRLNDLFIKADYTIEERS